MKRWFGFWFRLLCGIACLILLGMIFYHGDGDAWLAWLFFTVLGVAWLTGAYLRYPRSRKK